jgi:AcrR family transcriptional regulator
MSRPDKKEREDARSDPATRRRTQAERTEATRKLILDAAVRIMARKGGAGLRTGDVAKEAGVSVGAQLHHFPTKHELILAAFEYADDRSVEMSLQRAQFARRAPTPESIVSAIVADASDFFFGNGFFIELALAFGKADPDLRRVVRKSSRRSRFFIEKVWCDTLEGRGLPPDVASDILALTLSIIRGFAMRRFIEDDPARRAHLVKVWNDMIRAYLGTRLDEEQLSMFFSDSTSATRDNPTFDRSPLIAVPSRSLQRTTGKSKKARRATEQP